MFWRVRLPQYLPSPSLSSACLTVSPYPRAQNKNKTFYLSLFSHQTNWPQIFFLIDKVPLNQWMSRVGCLATQIWIPNSAGLIPNNSGPHAHLMRCFFLLETRTDVSHHGISFWQVTLRLIKVTSHHPDRLAGPAVSSTCSWQDLSQLGPKDLSPWSLPGALLQNISSGKIPGCLTLPSFTSGSS